MSVVAPPGSGGWLRRLGPLLRRHRRNMALSLAASMVGMGGTVASPLLIRRLVDDADAGQNTPNVVLAFLVGLGFLRFVSAVGRRMYAGRVSYDVEYDLRNALYAHLQRLDFAAHDSLATGQAVSRAGSDVRMIQGLLAFLPLMLGNVVMLVLSLVVMAFLSPALTLVVLAVLPVVAFASARSRSRLFASTWAAQQQAGALAGVVDETVTGIRVVKAFAAEEREFERLERAARDLFAARMRQVRTQARLVAFIQILPMIGLAGLLLVGGTMARRGDISLGTLLAFLSYLLQLAAPARMLTMLMATSQMARASTVRILELLDAAPGVREREGAESVGEMAGAIGFENVSFAYGDRPVLGGFNLHIRPGERVALVGASGSGKSTAALLLPRFYDPDEGRVTIDGRDVRGLRLAEVRRGIGLVFEDAFLFSSSIRDNIAYGRPAASDEAVAAAARAAGAAAFIEKLPDGYGTIVGERGLTLSGGQRQRITLARALLTDPRILVLDDATSAVDPALEAEIHATLRELMAGRTTLVIAHRRSTLALAERIVVVDAGQVVADGTHDVLMATCGLYRDLMSGRATGMEGSSESARRARRLPAAAALQLAGGAGGTGGGWGGGGRGMRNTGLLDAMEADDALLAQVAALPSADEEPGVDPEVQARPDPEFGLRSFVQPWRSAVLVGAALVAIDAVIGLAGPALVRTGIAHGVTGGGEPALWLAGGALAAIALADWWALWAGARWTGRLSERLLYALRLKVFAHLGRLGLHFYEREMGGRVMTRMTSDIEALAQLFQQGLATLVVAALTATGVAAALLVIDWRLAAAAMSVVPVLAVLTFWFRRSSDRAYALVRDKVAVVMANLQEGLSGVRVTQAFAREDRNDEEFAAVAGEHLAARLSGNRLQAMYFPAVELLGQVATVIVVGYGAGRVRDGTLGAADLIGFVLYLNLFFTPLYQLSQTFDVIQQGRAAAAKLADLLAIAPSIADRPAARSPAALRGHLRLEGVSFRYPGEQSDALNGLDLDLRPGETVALVGRTGAGKSTVVKLIARFYDPTEGRVTMDGIPLMDLETVPYRRRLGMVPQEPHLFAGTIAENIAYGRPYASEDEVRAAARAVGADTFISGLPDGYATPITERGRSLSAGQRQLVALARALLVDPVVLLLDEATSNLDLTAETQVAQAMSTVASGRTTLVIAHRLATAARADRIVVLDQGSIAEQGTHAELLARRGLYAHMWMAGDPQDLSA